MKLQSAGHYICLSYLTSVNLHIPPELRLFSGFSLAFLGLFSGSFKVRHLLKGTLFNLNWSLYTRIIDAAQNKVKRPTRLPLASHLQWPYSTPESNVVIMQQRWAPQRIFFFLAAIWMHVKPTAMFTGCATKLTISSLWLNSYNICLCQTIEFIQCINNETMATFHSATRLWAQWNSVTASKAFFVCSMNS